MTVSLRDYLAAHASEDDVQAHMTYADGHPTFQRTREEARYRYADAMIQARKGKTPQTVAAEETPGQWHLPSRDVLNAMYKHEVRLGGFAYDNYWSSSEHNNSDFAWFQSFGSGNQCSNHKDDLLRVRAVRALPDDTTETERLVKYNGVLYQAYPTDAPESMTWDKAVQWCEQLNREDV